jgi:hypothetical protein
VEQWICASFNKAMESRLCATSGDATRLLACYDDRRQSGARLRRTCARSATLVNHNDRQRLPRRVLRIGDGSSTVDHDAKDSKVDLEKYKARIGNAVSSWMLITVIKPRPIQPGTFWPRLVISRSVTLRLNLENSPHPADATAALYRVIADLEQLVGGVP